ncbi:hypothetical protein Ddye_015865 [Dipteronia dyeriana]|uniref:Bifunctional inhibitor/plant lipid transfer protein/seed storage helical domain-containing protein n=1 Tax=Dipteronia dyeriana TaxID=168575 RepID=A0AAD9WYX6_9ROSI|nr:hypothetical protein Ddye_015865 [Dipteronia dyeriana]
MAQTGIELGLVLVLVTVVFYGATAQSGCISVLIGLAPCLNYITGNASTPSSSCCSKLATVVQDQPQCLCTALNSGASSALGISINQTQALSLPGACNVQTPPISGCNGASGPAASSPVSPPADSSDNTPDSEASAPSIHSGNTGSKTTTGESTTSNGSSVTMPLNLTVFFLFLASCMLFLHH